MTNKSNPLAGKRFGVVGKWGSGKSTITILIANALREHGYEVCILDADSTNIGLHEALGLEKPPDSLIDYYGGMVFSGGSVTCPVDDPTPLPDAVLSLDQISDAYYAQNQEGITLLTAGKIGDLGPGAGCDGPINKVARDVKVLINGVAPLTLVDFKAGFEDSARGAITSLDWVLVVVDPTHAAIQMAIHMKEMLRQLKAGTPPATEHLESLELVVLAQTLFREAKVQDVLAILNKVRDKEMEDYLRDKLEEGGVEAIGIVREDPSLTSAWLKGVPIGSKQLKEEAEAIVAALETAETRAG